MAFELGIYSFGEITTDPVTGKLPTARQRIRDYIEQAEVADQVGLDVFALGEHHRSDFAVSATSVVLSAIAERTRDIRLSSAVTVLSSEDPVRVFQQYATLDLISGGRAEIIAGRGSYLESFPLFGYDLAEYDALFAEKLDLLLAIRERNPITWSGSYRPALHEADIAPRPLQQRLPVWLAVGGAPASVARAGRLELPLALAIIGGALPRFVPLSRLYRQAAQEAGHDPAGLRLSINSPGFVASTSQAARDLSYPYFDRGMLENFHERGHGFHTPRPAYDRQSAREGALVVGSPQEIIDKVMYQHELFGHGRLLIQLGFGGVPQRETLRAIELLGTEVAPVVRKELSPRIPPP
ncbi:flavin-dependent oxidoreductase, F420-dependent methylene-tetrahydromethanopterin reductase [Saccharomonospora marina XMU15]|uniref:Flavin-dependent oxidoreductase, F420-dependent methylene-tetrahydromethanopterin reductase n=1 Tax=Saccharomonospora marina XMU15 TaxID=882083 RepID=H5X0E2_9PSEU|nr:LLM class flavin-dependent oxidoreductase [Saccharomonospora marina]EHR49667.1 flavin-dependent oxidoreductase, F420-dependent methylene-tetrahydromethanopterin reductase [Saccharomonospora marina XMU15]